MARSTEDDDSFAALLEAQAYRGSVTPFRTYAARVTEVTADSLAGLLTPEELAVECDAAFAVLQDAAPDRHPETFRAILMALVTTAVEQGLSPDDLQTGIDTLLAAQ
jgi:hypothetical protein